MWVDPEDDPRESLDTGSDEKSVLAFYLDQYRLTFEMKCTGLDARQLALRSVPPSTMSLLGLVRHLANVEHSWFRKFIEGQHELPSLYESPDQGDWDFTGAVAEEPVVAEAWSTWRGEVTHSREVYASLHNLGELVGPRHNHEARKVIVHMIEEYARHCGHADLIRERVDGRVGQ
jgi:hypothetical protein